MRTLDRKLLRDLFRMKGQALAIAMVVASGVATFIMAESTLGSLRRTQEAYYRDYRFADVFSSLKRAPESLRERILEIPGVSAAETRVVQAATLDVPGFPDPVRGLLVSVPEEGGPLLNRVYLRKGRMVDPTREGEAVVGEPFAKAHRFSPGDTFAAVIDGKRKTLTIVGIGLSPEHVYEIGPGALFPDNRRYGIVWMARRELAAAGSLEGAFNDVSLALSPGAPVPDAIARLDAVLAPYGGLGAYGRKDQQSHRYLSEEFRQLGTTAAIFPVIFLGVAGFLLQVVLSRLVGTQRDQIAVLKAFGYANRDIGFHYAKLVVAIALVGTAIGTAGGVWLGRNMARTYMEFYRFPFLEFALRPGDVAVAAAMSVAVALSGTFLGVRRAARLPPAEAMRPETPERYRKTFLGRIGVERLLSQPARMIARHIGRRPVKSLATVLGVSMACAILTTGRFQEDAMNFLMDVEFRQARQDDVAVAFFEPASRAALHELKSIGGVREAEPYRTVPVRLRNGHRTYRTALQGYEVDARLVRVLDAGMRRVGMPAAGVLLTDQLGKILGVRTGDRLTVEALEGSRPVRETTVAGLSRQYVGVSGYMEISALNRLMREGDAISGAYLAVEPGALPEVLRRIKGMPRVAGAAMRENEIRGFRETMAESMLVFTLIVTALAGTIAIGVVYNSARIALSERSRELASLRVLGYTRGEISYILLGELAVYTLAAIPPGFLVGRALCAYIVAKFETDLYRIPLVLEADTYGFAAAVVLASALLSGLAVRWRLDRLDLVAVLKTRE